jgi:hypothetical protein
LGSAAATSIARSSRSSDSSPTVRGRTWGSDVQDGRPRPVSPQRRDRLPGAPTTR